MSMKIDFKKIQISRIQELINKIDVRIKELQKTKRTYLIRLNNVKLELEKL